MQIDRLDATPLEKFTWAQQQQQQQQQQQHQLHAHADAASLGQAEPFTRARDDLVEQLEYRENSVLLDTSDPGLLVGEHGIIHNSGAAAASSMVVGCCDERVPQDKPTLESTEDVQRLPTTWSWEDLPWARLSDVGDSSFEGLGLEDSLDLDSSSDDANSIDIDMSIFLDDD